MASFYTSRPEKISKDDFELLLDNYRDWIYRSQRPGAGTCADAIHKAREALLNAARLGVSEEGVHLTETITDRVRSALVMSFCDIYSPKEPTPPTGPRGKPGLVLQLHRPTDTSSNPTEDA